MVAYLVKGVCNTYSIIDLGRICVENVTSSQFGSKVLERRIESIQDPRYAGLHRRGSALWWRVIINPVNIQNVQVALSSMTWVCNARRWSVHEPVSRTPMQSFQEEGGSLLGLPSFVPRFDQITLPSFQSCAFKDPTIKPPRFFWNYLATPLPILQIIRTRGGPIVYHHIQANFVGVC